MSVQEEIRAKADEIEALRVQTGVLSLLAYAHQPKFVAAEPVFVADLDESRLDGYADRYFDLMFGLHRLFARPVDLVEAQMLDEVEIRCGRLEPVSLEVLRATA